jgi:hypothetical protein
MDQDRPFGARDERRGMLVIGDGMALGDADTLADATGLRLLDVVSQDEAADRLDRQVGCDVALLFCGQAGPVLERLIVQLETLAIQNQFMLVIIADLATVDGAYACVRDTDTQLLCAPDAADLAATLIAAATRDDNRQTVHDMGRESEGARLQQLSEEVGRIARTLEAITGGTGGHRSAAPSYLHGTRISDKPSDYIGMPALVPLGAPPETDHAPDLTATRVRDLLRARRMRGDFLTNDLFADPAWDMLLDLLAARLEHERVSVSSLCIASAVPPTTALRWLRTLSDRGMVVRQADPHDGRRIFIALADETVGAMTRWFAASRRFLC